MSNEIVVDWEPHFSQTYVSDVESLIQIYSIYKSFAEGSSDGTNHIWLVLLSSGSPKSSNDLTIVIFNPTEAKFAKACLKVSMVVNLQLLYIHDI